MLRVVDVNGHELGNNIDRALFIGVTGLAYRQQVVPLCADAAASP